MLTFALVILSAGVEGAPVAPADGGPGASVPVEAAPAAVVPAEIAPPPPPGARRLHMEAAVHVGWGAYEQRNWADRDVSGSANDGTFAIGARLGENFWVGGSTTAFAFVANSGEKLSSGETINVPIASGVIGGGIAGWAPVGGSVAADLTLGAFYGGASKKWGGLGAAIIPSFTWVVTRFGDHSVGITARLIWIPKVVAPDRVNDDTHYTAGQLGAEWRFN